jgi:hypothetical protein
MVCFLLGCASEPSKPVVEYFRLKDPKIDPELITSDGSTVTLEYEEIIPFEGNEIKLAVQTRETVSEEDQQKYSTPTHLLIGRTVTKYYVGENVVIPSGYQWQKYKMSNGRIEFRITDDENRSGMQSIVINLTQCYRKDMGSIPECTRISNSVSVKGIFQE